MLRSDLPESVYVWTITELEKESKLLGDHLFNIFMKTGYYGKKSIESAQYVSDLLEEKTFSRDDITKKIEDAYILTESEDKKTFSGVRLPEEFTLDLLKSDGKGYTCVLMRDELKTVVNLILEIESKNSELENILKPMTSQASHNLVSFKKVLAQK